MICFSCGDVHEGVRGPQDWTADHGIENCSMFAFDIADRSSRPGILKCSRRSTLKMTVHKMTPYLHQYYAGFYNLYLLLLTHW